MYLPHKYQQLNSENDIIFLDNSKFKVIQIKEQIIQVFVPRANDLNFVKHNSWLKRYFNEIKTQGIFNRVEWKYLLKPEIDCELLTTSNNSREKGKLQVKVSLHFLQLPSSLTNKDRTKSKNFEIEVSLDFCPDSPE